MARPRKNRDADQTDGIAAAHPDTAALEAAGQALTAHAGNLAVIEQRYGSGMPYNLELYIARGRELRAETGMRMLELGLILIQIKEREPVGEFAQALERIDIAPRFAQKCMQAAAKFSGDAKARRLAEQLGSAKILELVVEDDETIAELADGGTLAGYTADELATKTARELRELLRKERQDREAEKAADERIVEKKDKQIHKLLREKKLADKSPVREQVAESLEQLDALITEATSHLYTSRELIDRIRGAFAEAGEDVPGDIEDRLTKNTEMAADWLRALCADLGE